MNLKTLPAFIIILFIWLNSIGQQQDGSVFERRINIRADNQPLSVILDQISWQARVFFSYDASLIESTEKYTVEAIDLSLFSVLNQLFNSKKYVFTELENQIVISKRKADDKNEIKTDSIPVKYFFLSGKVIDKKKEFPISYASVSVANKPIGTLTNSDGEFILKLHPRYINDSLVISCMGYAQVFIPASRLLDDELIQMNSISIYIREVNVTATTPEKLLENIRANYDKNYSSHYKLMNAFYRETVKQDGNFINVSEAVIEILKAPYNSVRNDLARLVKGRQSPDVQPFNWVNFKLQGGPFTITQLDVAKTMESFINKKHEHQYEYKIPNVLWYNNIPVYVLEFEPVNDNDFHGFIGELFVHRETYAIVYARYGFNRSGLKKATSVLVKHTPPGVKARPSFVEYRVSYNKYQGKWQLTTARADIKFKVRSRRDKINSEFHSVSDLLITNIHPTDLKRLTPDESFSHRDIFTEMIHNYDPEFWENYNIIKPDEDLRNAIPTLTAGN
jgi:hypothetical protein